jgi:hypothetical protein
MPSIKTLNLAEKFKVYKTIRVCNIKAKTANDSFCYVLKPAITDVGPLNKSS